jgi:hypothetical protein
VIRASQKAILSNKEGLGVKRSITVLAFMFFGLTAFADEPDLVEAAKRATAYWNTLFGRCSNQSQRLVWYAGIFTGSGAGSIQMVPELRIQFKTEDLSEVERLNGFEFKVMSSLEPGPFRWWIPQNKAWRDWQVGEIAVPIVLIKKKGIWSQEIPNGRTVDERKAITICSQIPSMAEEKH